MTEKVIMSDIDPAGRPLPDIGTLTLSSLASDSAATAAEFRSLIFQPGLPARMAAFNSEIGGNECLLPSTNSS
ncbi:hypothetical protein OG429_06085 [Streptomyces sp. NBC_00190]|uniref:hypothetical protein n=1 Tax=unclassified Streptomyces TaxID=2593676 RepID=UPI002E2DC8E5|nr:hypothetical protein [Streptomyces sp. NBC_00190]WSZ38938.1 hypothetical protein OG239_09095 [Streptomyces sp. NBC_00868]